MAKGWFTKLFSSNADKLTQPKRAGSYPASFQDWVEVVNKTPRFTFDEKMGYRLNYFEFTPDELDRLYFHLDFIFRALKLETLSLSSGELYYPNRDFIALADKAEGYYQQFKDEKGITGHVLKVHRVTKFDELVDDVNLENVFTQYADMISYLTKLLKVSPTPIEDLAVISDDRLEGPLEVTFSSVLASVLYSPTHLLFVLVLASHLKIIDYLNRVEKEYVQQLQTSKPFHERTLIKRKLFEIQLANAKLTKFTIEVDFDKFTKQIGKQRLISLQKDYRGFLDWTHYFLFEYRLGRAKFNRRVLKLRQMANLRELTPEEMLSSTRRFIGSWLNYSNEVDECVEDILAIMYKDIETEGKE